MPCQGRRSEGVIYSKSLKHNTPTFADALKAATESTIPAVLIELGFLTNPAEERYLNDKANQSYTAAGTCRAFREYKRELEGG